MVSFNTGWNDENIQDESQWRKDNDEKVSSGFKSYESVHQIRHDIASLACVTWLRDEGRMDRDRVQQLAETIVHEIVRECQECEDKVIKDCVAIYASTRSELQIISCAYASYSLVGVRVANEIIGTEE